MIHRTYYIAAALLGLVLLLPWLLASDIAVDGAVNASIARNMAEGIGSLWQPLESATSQTAFTQHPPLAFGLEALFFLVLGDAWYVERVYSLFMALLTCWALIELWNTFHNERHQRRMVWLPVVFWITVPVVFWSYRNNMVDATLAMFTTFATVFMLRACVLQAAEFFVLGVIFTLAAFFTKGITGLFPLVIPMFYGLHDYRHGLIKGTVQTVAITLLLGGFVLGISLLIPSAGQNILHYLNAEVLTSWRGLNANTVGNRMMLCVDLLKQLLPALMCLSAVAMVRNQTRRASVEARRTTRFFVVLPLVAALPLVLLSKQPVQALLPAMPLFAMAFAMSVLSLVQQSMEDNAFTWRNMGFAFNTIAAATLVTLCLVTYNHPTHYRTLLSDTEQINAGVGNCKVVSCDWSTADDYKLSAYLQRRHGISLVGGTAYEYLLMKKTASLNPPEGYAVQLVPLNNYVLYRKADR